MSDRRGQLYCTDRADPEYRALLKHLERERICQFCAEGIALGLITVIGEGEHWYITKNRSPYQGTVAHHIAVYRRHIIDGADLAVGAGDELQALFAAFKRGNRLAGAAMLQRDGEATCTCASIRHLHVHFLAGGKGHPTTHEPLIFHYGYRPR